MADDLGLEPAEVHEPEIRSRANEVLGFWFELVMPEQRFAKSDSLDHEIRTLFGPSRDLVLASGAMAWRDDPETLLAAVILLDQFSRNIHRGTAQAFAGDSLAQELTCLAIERGWDAGMDPERRAFLYMPLMHAEDPELQTLSVECFCQPGLETNLDYARDHADVIARFGRFPTRNEALGRESTPEEKIYLSRPDVGW